MSDEFIKKALESAATDYMLLQIDRDGIKRQLDEVDREIAKLSLKIVSLAELCGDIPKDIAVSETLKEVSNIGLTDAVRSVLRASGEWMEAREVRDHIVRLGIDLKKYKNLLASVHTILDRLFSKEVEAASPRGSKKIVYRWKGPTETVWERLQKLPREKADEVVARTADSVATKEFRKVVRRRVKSIKASKK